MSLYLDLFSNYHDKEEYDNYFVISGGAYLLATLNWKKIIHSLVNACCEDGHRHPINKMIKTKTQEYSNMTFVLHKPSRVQMKSIIKKIRSNITNIFQLFLRKV